MGGNINIGVSWSDLPKELLGEIAKCLDSEIDVLRLRAVCSSWRSSTTPFKKFHCESVKLPFPFEHHPTSYFSKHDDSAYFRLVERTVYHFELPAGNQPNFWLVKIERLASGKLRILNPVTQCPAKILPETQLPRVLNTLNFRVSEVCKAYTLQYVNPSEPNRRYVIVYAKKVILSSIKNDEYVVMAIDNNDKLWYTKSGDKKWTMVRHYSEPFKFHDAVSYKGQFHGIDRWGGTWAFDLNFQFTRVSYNMYNNALRRHLVELCNGDLFLVEEVDKRRPRLADERPPELRRTAFRKPDVDIIIYAWGKNDKVWVEKKSMNDWLVVVGDDCSYAVSTKKFEGCKGTRVFFRQRRIIEGEDVDPDYAAFLGSIFASSECYCCDCCEYDGDDAGLGNLIAGFHSDNVGVWDYESRKTGSMMMSPEYADIFWPPTSWLNCG